LFLVSITYFFDEEKDVHWVGFIEKYLVKAGRLVAAEIIVCAAVVFLISRWVHPEERLTLLLSSAFGIFSFITMHGVMRMLKVPKENVQSLERQSFTLFIYLEMLDASFSLDGVVGAFAITNNLFIIAIGLGIGAMFVRSMTIMLVEERSLDQFRYLEHGAFYAIGALAAILWANLFIQVPEVITGLIGIAIVGFSLVSSVRHRRQEVRDESRRSH
jgi:uncharacterized protein